MSDIFFVVKQHIVMGPYVQAPLSTHDGRAYWRELGYEIIELVAPSTEERKVAALERIADALELMMGANDDGSEASNDDHRGGPATSEARRAEAEALQKLVERERQREDPDYVEPMNDRD